ncbi:MAG TPA: class I SAM-dependent methyltransferase [Candidatus Woesebacteria bacterium]|nr:class I SAM-dependent methyltransferase [Candidatus Woesebacteria bacterium]
MNTLTLQLPTWQDYQLIDSGDGEKLERFGDYTFIRPEPKAIWNKSVPNEWEKAAAIYQRTTDKEGKWYFKTDVSKANTIKWHNITFRIKPTFFKHTGIFPESTVHWEWMQKQIQIAKKPLNILNLFAYTGGGTLAALAEGASVTHVDALKEVVTWAHENAQLSGLNEKPVRWIVDDALTFVKREVKRSKTYDGIIIDPPKFGRSAVGKIWKFEEQIQELLDACRQILSPKPVFILLNTYTVEFSSITLRNLVTQMMQQYEGRVEHGEIVIPQKNSHILLPTSIFARWSRD